MRRPRPAGHNGALIITTGAVRGISPTTAVLRVLRTTAGADAVLLRFDDKIDRVHLSRIDGAVGDRTSDRNRRVC